ncbi:MAG: glycoside hydrolase [Clostridia bacterium]|nr:glycoside hydrolase [Clostridia bacterium]
MSVYKVRYGTPEEIVPSRFAPAPKCEIIENSQEISGKMIFSTSKRGTQIMIPIESDAGIYGFGLQLKGFQNRGKKKTLRPNADPVADSGDSHAPVPFFVTTKGFGVYVDTARYASFYCGRELRPESADNVDTSADAAPMVEGKDGSNIFSALYEVRRGGKNNFIAIDIPFAEGVDVYYITGDTVLDIVKQYNMLSGGGCMPPMWSLGCFYRCDMKFNSEQVLDMAHQFRDKDIPCDIIGLEPGWQTKAYSASFIWSPERFPDPSGTVKALRDNNFHVSLWQHSFTHPSSPLYKDLIENSGDYLVWNGLVPDFALESTKKIFADYQKKTLVDLGVDGFKLDECDGSDYTGSWSFPGCASFPSGADGEQYHSLFGTLYSHAVSAALGNTRSLGEIRNLGALAASYPYVLYSDLYDHKDFVTGVVNSGFSGILWTPEVRHALDKQDMIRRVQTTVFSVQALVNAFYLSEMPWEKHGCTEEIRELFRTRMSLIPYLFNAFYDYHTTGKPPVRALVCDYADERDTLELSDQYLFGDSMIVAPILSGKTERDFWLPKGEWFDFFTGERYEGGRHHIATDNIPVFVKGGTIVPIATPTNYIKRDTVLDITLRIYGDVSGDTICRLVSDSDDTHTATYTVHEIDKNTRGSIGRYNIVGVEEIK